MEKVECPYCEDYVEIDPSNQEHYEGTCVYECPNCSKNFEVFAEPTIHYSSIGKKAECLNGTEHNWIQTIGFPEIYFKGKYHCEDCSATVTFKEELATKEEWYEYNKN